MKSLLDVHEKVANKLFATFSHKYLALCQNADGVDLEGQKHWHRGITFVTREEHILHKATTFGTTLAENNILCSANNIN
jgi:hypothetical protein